MYEGFLFSTSSPELISCPFDNSHSIRCEVVIQCVFYLHLPNNQSILKEISPGCSLEGLMLKLKLQYLGPLMRRADSLEKTLMLGGLGAGGEGDNRG